MKFQRKSRAGLLLGLFLISLLFVLFRGKTTNSSTGVSQPTLGLNGITNFKLGLDIAGGVKLTYKIDYSKYREIYTDQMSFDSMKKVIEGIVLQNIDERISKLGVSDYSAYAQNLNGEEYIIVEI
jgi:preprotein translocase subunit SecD